jgi:phosphoribosyl 1,2-cyclic phosphodiesterase
MSAPKRHPTGMVNVSSTAQMQGRLEVFGFGFDDRAISPGDLVIITTDQLMQNGHKQSIEFALRIRGRDMHLFEKESHIARLLWDENQHWLNAPSATPDLDMRSASQIRQSDQMDLIARFSKK